MNILFISHNLLAGNIARLLKEEGHKVKLYIGNKKAKNCFDYIVEKTEDWRSELDWVGKEGLIIFDDVGYGSTQDKLRKKGFAVVGSSALGEKLEEDREFGMSILKQNGINVPELAHFYDIDEAITFIKKHPKPWVIKDNGKHSKKLSYVSRMEDGRDAVDFLSNALTRKSVNSRGVTLQEKIDGIEIGVGRYFNGQTWIGPIEYNIEHPRLFPGDLGPLTSEMGTLAWFSENEKEILYKNTIAKMGKYLQEINFRGDFEINCIVNEKGIFPLEITPRFGTPIVHLHSELFNFKWGNFLNAVARGEKFTPEYKKGYGVVVLLAVPPFPYQDAKIDNFLYGINIHFKDLSNEEKSHIHFEEVAKRPNEDQYYIADSDGYVLYVTGEGKTIKEAQEKAYSIASKIVLPRTFYRNDIGTKFANQDQKILKNWGYLR